VRRVASVVALVAACGGSTAKPSASTAVVPAAQPAASVSPVVEEPAVVDAPATPVPEAPVAAHVAVLPRSIVSLTRLPLAWVSQPPMMLDLGIDKSECWKPLAARIDGLFYFGTQTPLNDTVPRLLHGDVGVEEIAKCFEKGARKKSKDKRVVAYVGGGVPHVIATIAPGWILLAREQATARAFLAESAMTDNPLRRVAAAPFSRETWAISASDFTGDLLDVPSLGARIETDEKGGGTVIGTLLFADTASAKLALARFEKPHAELAADALAENVAEARAFLHDRGTLRVVGAAIEFRGTLGDSDTWDPPTNVFVATANPPR
jgi:hypothetical protein